MGDFLNRCEVTRTSLYLHLGCIERHDTVSDCLAHNLRVACVELFQTIEVLLAFFEGKGVTHTLITVMMVLFNTFDSWRLLDRRTWLLLM